MAKTKRLHLMGDNFCPYPLHTHIESATFLTCTKLCLETPGCLSFNFQPQDGAKGKVGQCVTVAPHSGAHGINSTDLVAQKWQMFRIDIAYPR